MFKWLKILGVTLGTFLCLLYFLFLVTEGDNAVLGFLFGLPFLAWPFVAWQWTNIGALSMLIVGIVGAWFFMMSSLFQSTAAGETGFIVMGLIPTVIVGAMLLYYWHIEGV